MASGWVVGRNWRSNITAASMDEEETTQLVQQEERNAALPEDLGTSDTIELVDFEDLDEEDELNFAGFLAALPVTTTLTSLTVYVSDTYTPTPESNRRVVEPLCHAIANVRRDNENHPLELLSVGNLQMVKNPGILDMLQQFLAAAKQGGISKLGLFSMYYYLPVQTLMEFCRDNRSLRDVEIFSVYVSGADALTSTTTPAAMLFLDRLSLGQVDFKDSAAAIEFANFAAHMNIATLELGRITVGDGGFGDDDSYDDCYDDELNLVISKLVMPSVERLVFGTDGYRFDTFTLVFEAAKTSVSDLVVVFTDNERDKLEKYDALSCMIQGAVQLRRLKITDPTFADALPPPDFFQAVEANATITEILVSISDWVVLDPEEMQRLQRFTPRNMELARFVASPGTYPLHMLLALMCQFNKSPTGRYMMTRCLPSVFSFDSIKSAASPTMEPKQKKRKSEQT